MECTALHEGGAGGPFGSIEEAIGERCTPPSQRTGDKIHKSPVDSSGPCVCVCVCWTLVYRISLQRLQILNRYRFEILCA